MNKKSLIIIISILAFITIISISAPLLPIILPNCNFILLNAIRSVMPSEWLGFWGTWLLFTVTAVLGVFVYYQNKQLGDANKRANDINQRLLEFDEARLKPYISITNNKILFTKYEKINNSDIKKIKESLDIMSCYIGDNYNIRLEFSIKNISENYITRLYVSEIQISGTYPDGKQTPTWNAILESKKESIVLNSVMAPNKEKNLDITFCTSLKPSFYNIIFVLIKLKLVYLHYPCNMEQQLNFIIVNSIENQEMVIIGEDIMNK